jgi:thiamine-phosphate diphosphorylase
VKTPIICAVTDGRGDVVRTLALIHAATHAGVDLIQIREPLPDRALVDLTRAACDAARGTAVRVLVNDRLDVALAAGAHGVHLRSSSFSAARGRMAAGEAFLIGRSVHDLDEAVAVEGEGGCDYVLFGTLFPSASKRSGHRTAGLEALREVCARVKLPVVAIGGITPVKSGPARAAGAAGVAGISLFEDLDSISSVVESLRRTFDTRS